jgi:hypothetical protein
MRWNAVWFTKKLRKNPVEKENIRERRKKHTISAILYKPRTIPMDRRRDVFSGRVIPEIFYALT